MEHTNYTIEELQKMSTVQLLSMLKSARAQISMHSKNKDSDCAVYQVISEVCIKPFEEFSSKLKEVLSTREHIPNKQERRLSRRLKQQKKQLR